MGPEIDALQSYKGRSQEMVLASTLCNMGRQNNSEKGNQMFAIFYDNGSAPDDTPGCGGGHIASKISRENGLECRINRVASSSLD